MRYLRTAARRGVKEIMNDHPILFRPEMILALLDGRKTQTRRPIKEQGRLRSGLDGAEYLNEWGSWQPWVTNAKTMRCPYGQPGARLWVREAFRGSRGYDNIPPSEWGNKPIWYPADGTPGDLWGFLSDRTRPSIHMPRWASRITLTLTEVRVQQIQDISSADAIAEGVWPTDAGGVPCWAADERSPKSLSPVVAFRDIINSTAPGTWESNGWHWALTFTVANGNIDQGAQHGATCEVVQ